MYSKDYFCHHKVNLLPYRKGFNKLIKSVAKICFSTD